MMSSDSSCMILVFVSGEADKPQPGVHGGNSESSNHCWWVELSPYPALVGCMILVSAVYSIMVVRDSLEDTSCELSRGRCAWRRVTWRWCPNYSAANSATLNPCIYVEHFEPSGLLRPPYITMHPMPKSDVVFTFFSSKYLLIFVE